MWPWFSRCIPPTRSCTGNTIKGAHWWAFMLNLALVLPLALRRRAPTAVFGVVMSAAVQWLVGESLPGDFAILRALYTVAAHESRKRALSAAGVVEFGVILAAIRYSPGHGLIPSIVFLTGIVAAGLFIGTTLRARRAYLAALVERAAQLSTSATSRHGWPQRPNAPGSPGRCMTSSPTASRL
ncbi:MAG: DUF7134 domain-containing protein [Mycobacteriaceae bacterium]